MSKYRKTSKAETRTTDKCFFAWFLIKLLLLVWIHLFTLCAILLHVRKKRYILKHKKEWMIVWGHESRVSAAIEKFVLCANVFLKLFTKQMIFMTISMFIQIKDFVTIICYCFYSFRLTNNNNISCTICSCRKSLVYFQNNNKSSKSSFQIKVSCQSFEIESNLTLSLTIAWQIKSYNYKLV